MFKYTSASNDNTYNQLSSLCIDATNALSPEHCHQHNLSAASSSALLHHDVADLFTSDHYYSTALAEGDPPPRHVVPGATDNWQSFSRSALLSGKVPPPRRHNLSSQARNAVASCGNAVALEPEADQHPPNHPREEVPHHYYSLPDVPCRADGYDHLDDKGSGASSSPPLVQQDHHYNHLVSPSTKQSETATDTAERLWQVVRARSLMAASTPLTVTEGAGITKGCHRRSGFIAAIMTHNIEYRTLTVET